MNTIIDFLVLAVVVLIALYYLYVRLWKNAGKCQKGSCGSCNTACNPPPPQTHAIISPPVRHTRNDEKNEAP